MRSARIYPNYKSARKVIQRVPWAGGVLRHLITGAVRACLLVSVSVSISVADAGAQPVKAPALPIVRQRFSYDCGVSALAHLLSVRLQRRVEARELTATLPRDLPGERRIQQDGYSLAQLAIMAAQMGVEPRMERISATALPELSLPVLVHLRLTSGPHFSVLTAVAGDSVSLADPSQGALIWPRSRFLAAWAPHGAGYILTVTGAPAVSTSAPLPGFLPLRRHE
ncbi:MAG: cysteine peptidase family C39 domain-containing protein [Luminiphilus sp.]|jgi:predicted double-glycine peptidase|nr:cysteine peptidase family C39 domain-containing protein [Luminiphilus sp.]